MTKTLNIQALIPAFIVAVVLVFSVFVALPASAQEPTIKDKCTITKEIKFGGAIYSENDVVGPVGSGVTKETKDWGAICLVNTINVITDWIFFLLVSVAFILILIAGFLWMTAGANPDNQKKAAAMIGAALVGIVIAILSRIIPGIVIGILS